LPEETQSTVKYAFSLTRLTDDQMPAGSIGDSSMGARQLLPSVCHLTNWCGPSDGEWP